MSTSLRKPIQGIVHEYDSHLMAFEHISNGAVTRPENIILFVGGLYDGLLTVPYPEVISRSLPPNWSIAQVLLSSSNTGWGTSSLQKDVTELSCCVEFFRQHGRTGKIVIMGNSTGCQDVMEYLTGEGHVTRSPIQGGILQAPVSDRESLLAGMGEDIYWAGCKAAKEMIAAGNSQEIMHTKLAGPLIICPVTAYRFLSLASPDHDGDDDYFSGDLTDEQLMKSFGALPEESKLCVLFSGDDEYMSATTDKEKTLQHWFRVVKEGKGSVDEKYSGVIKGASHNLKGNPDDVVADMVERVLGFIEGL